MANNNTTTLGIIGVILAAILGWGIYESNKPATSAAVSGCKSCGQK